MTDIPSTPADGNLKVVWVPTIADPDAPTAAELSAAGAVDVSCYLTGDGWAPSLSEDTISDPRLCETATFEQPGRAQRSLSVTYIENPGDATNNKAYDTFIPGTAGYFVVRRGKAFDTAFAAADKVDVWPVKAGAYSPNAPTANSVLTVTQKMFVTAKVRTQVAVS